MINFIMSFLAAAAVAVPVAVGLGLVYFYLAAMVVDFFRLNYGPKPIGYHFMNAALVLTAISYFIAFAFLLRTI